MSQRSRAKNDVERAQLLDATLDNLRWIHPDVKITIAFSDW